MLDSRYCPAPYTVFQHRGGTPPINCRKILSCRADLPLERVPIGADWDPSPQANSADKSKPCFRSVWGPTWLLIYTKVRSHLAFGQASTLFRVRWRLLVKLSRQGIGAGHRRDRTNGALENRTLDVSLTPFLSIHNHNVPNLLGTLFHCSVSGCVSDII
jgi:hypothetical protein